MRLHPRGELVMIRRDPTPDRYGSLFIPESARKKAQFGRVIGVGPKVLSVQVGETVLFGQYATIEVQVADGPVLFIREQDIMAGVDP